MKLKVVDKDEGLTTVVEVMCAEHRKGESSFDIFDFMDNAATVHTKESIYALNCVERLYDRSYAEIEGSIEWS